MEEKVNLIESLMEKAADYWKTSFELVKLRAIDRLSDQVSTLVPHSVTLVLVLSFMLFISLGLSLWIGDILGKIYYGFFIVASFYGLVAIILHFFLHRPFKKMVSNYFIRNVFK
jgi:hypothetical protein